jgi:hypothetical protein
MTLSIHATPSSSSIESWRRKGVNLVLSGTARPVRYPFNLIRKEKEVCLFA